MERYLYRDHHLAVMYISCPSPHVMVCVPDEPKEYTINAVPLNYREITLANEARYLGLQVEVPAPLYAGSEGDLGAFRVHVREVIASRVWGNGRRALYPLVEGSVYRQKSRMTEDIYHGDHVLGIRVGGILHRVAFEEWGWMGMREEWYRYLPSVKEMVPEEIRERIERVSEWTSKKNDARCRRLREIKLAQLADRKEELAKKFGL